MTRQERFLWSIIHARPSSVAHEWTKDAELRCSVCGGFDRSLLTSCPGYRLSQETLHSIRRGKVKDFAMVQLKREKFRRRGS